MKWCYLRCNCAAQGLVHKDAAYVDIDTGRHWFWQWSSKDAGLFCCAGTACPSTLAHIVAYTPATRTARGLCSAALFNLEPDELLGVMDDLGFVQCADVSHMPLYYPPHACMMAPEDDGAVAWGYKANQSYFSIRMDDQDAVKRLLERLEGVCGRAASSSTRDDAASPRDAPVPNLVLVECFAGTQPLTYACLQAARMGRCKLVGLAAVDANLDTANSEPHLPLAVHDLVPRDRCLQLFDMHEADLNDESVVKRLLRWFDGVVGEASRVLLGGGPPCQAYSAANKTSLESDRAAQLAKGDKLVASMLRMHDHMRAACAAAGVHYGFVMENVHGSNHALRERPVLRLRLAAAAADLHLVETNWCCYGHRLPRKHTDIFTNLMALQGRRCTQAMPCLNQAVYGDHTVHTTKVLGSDREERSPWPLAFAEDVVDVLLGT